MGRRSGTKGSGSGEATTPESALAALLSGHGIADVSGGDFDWVFAFDNEAELATESPWRILVENRIVLSSGDHGQDLGSGPVDGEASARDLLTRRRLEDVGIRPDTGDLTLVLEGRTVLELLNMSAGFEGWRVTGEGIEVIALGGGEVKLLRE